MRRRNDFGSGGSEPNPERGENSWGKIIARADGNTGTRKAVNQHPDKVQSLLKGHENVNAGRFPFPVGFGVQNVSGDFATACSGGRIVIR